MRKNLVRAPISVTSAELLFQAICQLLQKLPARGRRAETGECPRKRSPNPRPKNPKKPISHLTNILTTLLNQALGQPLPVPLNPDVHPQLVGPSGRWKLLRIEDFRTPQKNLSI